MTPENSEASSAQLDELFPVQPAGLAKVETTSAQESPVPPENSVTAKLEAASKGLLMPSETDSPFKAVFYPEDKAEKMTPGALAGIAGAPDGAKVESRELDNFFRNAVSEEDWMGDDEKATVKKFNELLKTIKSELKDVQVVLWGDAEKQVAIIGKCEGGLAGLLTTVVET